jgi:hypothetical protein
MEKIKSFDEFISENKTATIDEQILKLAFNCVYEAESGEVTVTVNEGFVQDLQLHIRKTLDILVSQGIKGSKLDKALEAGLSTLTSSFQNGDTPEESAVKIAK